MEQCLMLLVFYIVAMEDIDLNSVTRMSAKVFRTEIAIPLQLTDSGEAKTKIPHSICICSLRDATFTVTDESIKRNSVLAETVSRGF